MWQGRAERSRQVLENSPTEERRFFESQRHGERLPGERPLLVQFHHGRRRRPRRPVESECGRGPRSGQIRGLHQHAGGHGTPIKQEYAQSIRVNLITQLTKRQRTLQEARALLDDSAPGFLDLRQNRDYKGDAYPGGIPKLNVMLEGYPSPADVVGEAIKSLKTKYDVQDADLAK
jgi:hypothetical protein